MQSSKRIRVEQTPSIVSLPLRSPTPLLLDTLSAFSDKNPLKKIPPIEIQKAIDHAKSITEFYALLRAAGYDLKKENRRFNTKNFIEIKFGGIIINELTTEISTLNLGLTEYLKVTLYKMSALTLITYLNHYNYKYYSLRFAHIKITEFLKIVRENHRGQDWQKTFDTDSRTLAKWLESIFRIDFYKLIDSLVKMPNATFMQIYQKDLGTLSQPTDALNEVIELMSRKEAIRQWVPKVTYPIAEPILIPFDGEEYLANLINSSLDPSIKNNATKILGAFRESKSITEMLNILDDFCLKQQVKEWWPGSNLDFCELKFIYDWDFRAIIYAIGFYNLPIKGFLEKFTNGLCEVSLHAYLQTFKTNYNICRYVYMPISQFLFQTRFAYSSAGERIETLSSIIEINFNITLSFFKQLVFDLLNIPAEKLFEAINKFSLDEFEQFCNQDLGLFVCRNANTTPQLNYLLNKTQYQPTPQSFFQPVPAAEEQTRPAQRVPQEGEESRPTFDIL